jgi:hypothetical protein
MQQWAGNVLFYCSFTQHVSGILHPSSGVQETVVIATSMVKYPDELGGVEGKNR